MDSILLIIFYVFVIGIMIWAYRKANKQRKIETEKHLESFGSKRWDRKDADK